MGFMKWNDGYSVNVAEIDDQHKKLINLLNQVYDAMSVGKGKEALGKILTELVDYTVYHFKKEEHLLQRNDYAEFNAHKRIHDELTKKAVGYKEEYNRSGSVNVIDVVSFLKGWLNTHILEVDKRYSPHLNGKGVH